MPEEKSKPEPKADKPVEQTAPEPAAPAMVPLDAVQGMIAKAVAEAMAKKVHQHTPIGQVLQVELSGRTREEGTILISKLDETKSYTEYGFNDGTVRRDYK